MRCPGSVGPHTSPQRTLQNNRLSFVPKSLSSSASLLFIVLIHLFHLKMSTTPHRIVSGGLVNSVYLSRVPILVGADSFTEWKVSLKALLDSVNPKYYQLLSGAWAMPEIERDSATPADISEDHDWHMFSRQLLIVIRHTIHYLVRSQIDQTNARTAYLSIERTFTSTLQNSGYRAYERWIGIRYDGRDSSSFTQRWEAACYALRRSSDRGLLKWRVVVFQFITAVSGVVELRPWARAIRVRNGACTEEDYNHLRESFLSYEGRRLSGALRRERILAPSRSRGNARYVLLLKTLSFTSFSIRCLMKASRVFLSLIHI